MNLNEPGKTRWLADNKNEWFFLHNDVNSLYKAAMDGSGDSGLWLSCKALIGYEVITRSPYILIKVTIQGGRDFEGYVSLQVKTFIEDNTVMKGFKR